jgi:hypothetical protein
MLLEKAGISSPVRDLALLEALDRRRFLQLMSAGGVAVAAGLASKSAFFSSCLL